jgi:hypothetical protein
MGMNALARQDGAIYELWWRAPGAEGGAPTIGAMIERLERAAEELRALAGAGVIVKQVAGDHVILITRAAAVAKQYGFRRREDEADPHSASGRHWRAHVTCARP